MPLSSVRRVWNAAHLPSGSRFCAAGRFLLSETRTLQRWDVLAGSRAVRRAPQISVRVEGGRLPERQRARGGLHGARDNAQPFTHYALTPLARSVLVRHSAAVRCPLPTSGRRVSTGAGRASSWTAKLLTLHRLRPLAGSAPSENVDRRSMLGNS
jgi:hypothetical protein